jgi:hypothetical protein
MYRADKISPVKCLKRIPYRWTILVRLVLSRTGLCNCDLFMDGTYLVCGLPDLGPPKHVL